MRKYKSGSQKRREKKARWEQQRPAYIAENPTPYEHWEDVAHAYREAINAAHEASMQRGGTKVYHYHPNRKSTCKLSVDDLAATYFAVDRVGKKGVSYGQILKCYERCGIGKSNAKIAKALRVLVKFGLIEKTGNYSTGKRGNVYERRGILGRLWKPKPTSSPQSRADDV